MMLSGINPNVTAREPNDYPRCCGNRRSAWPRGSAALVCGRRRISGYSARPGACIPEWCSRWMWRRARPRVPAPRRRLLRPRRSVALGRKWEDAWCPPFLDGVRTYAPAMTAWPPGSCGEGSRPRTPSTVSCSMCGGRTPRTGCCAPGWLGTGSGGPAAARAASWGGDADRHPGPQFRASDGLAQVRGGRGGTGLRW